MDPIHHAGYACPDCGTLHGEEIGALKCCRPAIRHEDYWECESCGTDHEGFREANACCRPEDEREAILSVPTPLELESFGQLQLIN